MPLEQDVVEILELAGGMEALAVKRAGFNADSLQPRRGAHQACCHAALSPYHKLLRRNVLSNS
ncbi:hypothetical protein ACRALDRAFT_2032988 [Sodiomyces alcalophilus JCM 7366]|uniref:uncharacterized protein n=1 Tax=Sodiomyces alcalophilus JCM 7366 TaxID=591952 RepID=UPI0039B65A2C